MRAGSDCAKRCKRVRKPCPPKGIEKIHWAKAHSAFALKEFRPFDGDEDGTPGKQLERATPRKDGVQAEKAACAERKR